MMLRTHCVTQGKSLPRSGPPFAHLQNVVVAPEVSQRSFQALMNRAWNTRLLNSSSLFCLLKTQFTGKNKLWRWLWALLLMSAYNEWMCCNPTQGQNDFMAQCFRFSDSWLYSNLWTRWHDLKTNSLVSFAPLFLEGGSVQSLTFRKTELPKTAWVSVCCTGELPPSSALV